MHPRTGRYLFKLAGRAALRLAAIAVLALALGTLYYRFAVSTEPSATASDGSAVAMVTRLSGACVCPSPSPPATVTPVSCGHDDKARDGSRSASPTAADRPAVAGTLSSAASQPVSVEHDLKTRACAVEAGSNSTAMANVSAAASPADLDNNAFIIPNVYHFIRFDQPHVTFVEMLAIKSVLRLNSHLVLIHCNKKPEGKFWEMVKDDRRLMLVHRDPPADIYGKTPHWVQHKSDLVRIQVLREYGGIYMDNDCIMLRSVDHLRKGHRCVVAKSSKEKYLGNMFAMAAMGCRFLAMYEDLYKTQYNPDLWYYNAGELPTTAILEKYPGVAHVIDAGIEMGMIRRLFVADEPVEAFSSTYDVLHTFYNHRYVIEDKTDYNTVDYRQYNNSFVNIARWLLDT